MILLTAGHTGPNTGAQCATTQFDEGSETIWLRNRVAEILTNKYGLVVLMDDDTASLKLLTKALSEDLSLTDDGLQSTDLTPPPYRHLPYKQGRNHESAQHLKILPLFIGGTDVGVSADPSLLGICQATRRSPKAIPKEARGFIPNSPFPIPNSLSTLPLFIGGVVKDRGGSFPIPHS